MDAFVFPSTWEGLGIVAIEAQASGLECYLSRELPKEVEVTDAVTWFDVSENENAIANMIDLTKVPEETRYIRNREVAENGYDMQETANRLMKIYLSLIGESMHIRAAFIIASEAIYSPSAEYKRVPDKIINKAKQWSEQYPKKIEFQEAYFGLLFSRLKYAQAQDMRNEQRRVYREMKTVAERANYSEYNESNQLMESVDILHRVFGY